MRLDHLFTSQDLRGVWSNKLLIAEYSVVKELVFFYNEMLWDDLPRAPYKRRAGGTPDTKFPGGHRSRVTPVPIPNTEVKPATADGTACVGAWESRSLPGINCTPRGKFRIAGARS